MCFTVTTVITIMIGRKKNCQVDKLHLIITFVFRLFRPNLRHFHLNMFIITKPTSRRSVLMRNVSIYPRLKTSDLLALTQCSWINEAKQLIYEEKEHQELLYPLNMVLNHLLP